MINEELTFQRFGYYSKDLHPNSNKNVVVNCIKCSTERVTRRCRTSLLCKSCAKKGKPNLKRIGQKHSEETKIRISNALKGRICSEETKLKMSLTRKGRPVPWLTGKNSPNWKGGISNLAIILRNIQESITWREQIFQRDNYTCQKCQARSCKGNRVCLEAHHIKEFSEIYKEFLQQYSQFSSIEDKETLTRLATTYQPFWDTKNGQTLCYNCHDLVGKEK